MTIAEMINGMHKNYKEIMEIRLELKYTQKGKVEIFDGSMKDLSEWAFMLTKRAIENYRKPQITIWYNQSIVALKHAKRIQAA